MKFEKSPNAFHKFPQNYLHCFEQSSDTGLQLELLQKYIFIPLDIFQKNKHNKIVTDKLDAWLMFFSTDHPEDMIRLIEGFPEFKPLYEEIYHICRNMEKVMGIFSEELRQMDRNTTQYMIDLMQDEIDQKDKTIEEMGQTIEQILIAHVRNFVKKGISPEECAEILSEDISLVLPVYEKLQDHLNLNDSEICELLQEE